MFIPLVAAFPEAEDLFDDRLLYNLDSHHHYLSARPCYNNTRLLVCKLVLSMLFYATYYQSYRQLGQTLITPIRTKVTVYNKKGITPWQKPKKTKALKFVSA